jgi:hypothetical protein
LNRFDRIAAAAAIFLFIKKNKIKKIINALWFPDLLYRCPPINEFFNSCLITAISKVLLAGVSPPEVVPLSWLVRPFG